MVLVHEKEAEEIFKTFGYGHSDDALSKLRRADRNDLRFTVPLQSLRQAAISDSMIGSIVAANSGGAATSAIVWLKDWSIYYAYELRMFWKVMGYDLVGGKRPEFSAIYWPNLEPGDADRIKSAYFIMMAFEFSGCVLFKNPNTAICVDDGEVVASSSDEPVRKDLADQIRDIAS